jgi:hypothetical protein
VYRLVTCPGGRNAALQVKPFVRKRALEKVQHQSPGILQTPSWQQRYAQAQEDIKMGPTWTIVGLDVLALVCVVVLASCEFGEEHAHTRGLVAAPGAQAAALNLVVVRP